MKKLLFATILILFINLFLFADTNHNISFNTLSPEPQHMKECQLITYLLTNNHYQRKVIDDSLSSEVFDRYIEILDNGKFYFLDSDIRSVEKYRYLFDDFLNAGRVQHGYDIFSIYQKRYAERLEHV